MPDREREVFDQANTEKLLLQIEERLTHSREIIGQMEIIRQLRFTAGGSNRLRPGVSVPALPGFGP